MGSKIYGVNGITGDGGELDLATSGRISFGGENYAKVSELGTPNDNSVTTLKVVDGAITEAKLDSGIDAQTFDATFSTFTYEPVPVGSESVDAISSHLNGIDEHFKHIKLDTFQGTAGEAISDGDVCYMNDSDGKLYKATDSTAVGNLFIADDSAVLDDVLTFIMSGAYEGLNYETGQTFDTSKPIYVSATEAGKVTFVKPSNGVVVAYALSTADEFFIKGESLSSSVIRKDGSVAMTAALDMGSNLISNVTDPSSAQDAATKAYVDAADAGMLKSDGSVAMTAAFDAGNQKITLVAEPTVNSDAATKNYVDASTSGLGAFWTTAAVDGGGSNLTLSGEQTLDGILTSSSRVLVRGQTDASENGIYVSAAGSWSRATDADADAEFKTNKTVFIQYGDVCAGCVFAYTGPNDPVVGTDDIDFTLKQTAAAISDGSITTSKLAADAVTNAKLADNAVDSENIVAGAVDNSHISGVDATKIDSGVLADGRVQESNVTQHAAALVLSASQTTSGQFADGRIQESNVTQHAAALVLTSSQISDLSKSFTQANYASQANGTVTIKSNSSDMIWGIKVFVATAYTTGTLTVGDSGDPDRLSNSSTIDLTTVGLSEFTVAHKYTTTDIEGVFASMSGAGDVYILLEHVAS